MLNDQELSVLERIAVALERIAAAQEKVIGENPQAEAFVRVVTGARTS